MSYKDWDEGWNKGFIMGCAVCIVIGLIIVAFYIIFIHNPFFEIKQPVQDQKQQDEWVKIDRCMNWKNITEECFTCSGYWNTSVPDCWDKFDELEDIAIIPESRIIITDDTVYGNFVQHLCYVVQKCIEKHEVQVRK